MPFDSLKPPPDACRSDPSAPCLYWHLKLHALNGGRDKLSERELLFVGVGIPARSTSGGWRSANGIASVVEDLEMSAETAAMLRALVRFGSRDRLEFLG